MQGTQVVTIPAQYVPIYLGPPIVGTYRASGIIVHLTLYRLDLDNTMPRVCVFEYYPAQLEPHLFSFSVQLFHLSVVREMEDDVLRVTSCTPPATPARNYWSTSVVTSTN